MTQGGFSVPGGNKRRSRRFRARKLQSLIDPYNFFLHI